MHTTFISTPHGVHWHLGTHSRTISKATFTTASSFHKFITMNQIQVVRNYPHTHACNKVLSCDTKGDHVTLKYARTNLQRSSCILHNRNIIKLIPACVFFCNKELWGALDVFCGEVLAASLLTQLQMTQCLTSQKHTAQKGKKNNSKTGSTMVKSADQTQEISVLIG